VNGGRDRSSRDPQPLDEVLGLARKMSREAHVRGTAPMLLCGRALAGASLARDHLGHVPGFVTAEELAL
jgi:hypothetical protein